MDAPGLETGDGGEPAQDEERTGAGERAAFRVQEELGPVAPVEIRPSPREVAPQRLDRPPADRDDALLAALPDDPDEAVVEVDAPLREPARPRDPEARPAEELDERPVPHVARPDAP